MTRAVTPTVNIFLFISTVQEIWAGKLLIGKRVVSLFVLPVHLKCYSFITAK
jgi:hypothetical protein